MRITLRADSMEPDDAHMFVAAFQRTIRRHDLPKQIGTLPTAEIAGPTSWTITTPSLTEEHAGDLLVEFNNMRSTRAVRVAIVSQS